MIKLIEVLKIQPTDYKNYKVHFAIGAKNQLDKLEMFYAGTFTADQNIQTKNNFDCKYVISLVFIGSDKWVFAGAYDNSSPSKTLPNGNIQYNMTLMNNQKDLIGRIIVYYKRSYRISYTFLNTLIVAAHDLEVVELTQNKFSIIDFPGYNKLDISFVQLKTIINNSLNTWKTALSHAKGIYLITDSKTGKHYVGSAKGQHAIWQRWSDYIKDGHGGNVELKTLVMSTPGYEKNFQYSILEVCASNTVALYIDERESYWKDILQSRKPYGLNDN